jgi:hypothetical protein
MIYKSKHSLAQLERRKSKSQHLLTQQAVLLKEVRQQMLPTHQPRCKTNPGGQACSDIYTLHSLLSQTPTLSSSSCHPSGSEMTL